MKIKFKFYNFKAKHREKEIKLFKLKAIFLEDKVDFFMHFPFFTLGLVVYEKEGL